MKAGEFVNMTSHFEREARVARCVKVVPSQILRTCAVTYDPEANVLVSVRSVDDGRDQPTFKSVRLTLASSR